MYTLKVEELRVPVGAMLEVASMLEKTGLTNTVNGSDEDDDVILLEISYDKDDKDERKAFDQIESVVDNYEEEEEDDEN
ncbi:MAG: hypothetical protein J0H74_03815 [Chitinophagaceae bacterium]|nr:hypothetical protein [Chitinophagaceae bacterium]